MGKVVYTTDVAHCSGRACPIRSKCYRYWLHKNNKAKYSGTGFAHYFVVKYDFKTEQCEMYKPIE